VRPDFQQEETTQTGLQTAEDNYGNEEQKEVRDIPFQAEQPGPLHKTERTRQAQRKIRK
jgi:hypothetical protein